MRPSGAPQDCKTHYLTSVPMMGYLPLNFNFQFRSMPQRAMDTSASADIEIHLVILQHVYGPRESKDPWKCWRSAPASSCGHAMQPCNGWQGNRATVGAAGHRWGYGLVICV